MSLVREIQDAATSEQTDLPTLLRKCLVLAARLGSAELRSWVNAELRGYPPDVDLPRYRLRGTHVRGTLRSGFEIGKNLPIPIYQLDNALRKCLTRFALRQSVASLERMTRTDQVSLQIALPAELVLLLNEGLGHHTHCLNAYRLLAVQDLVEILDTVRTRVLDFVLELENLHPSAVIDDQALATAAPDAELHQLFVTVIVGDQLGELVIGTRSEQNVTNSTVGAVAHGPTSRATGRAQEED